MKIMAEMMDKLRGNPPSRIAGSKVVCVSDYETSAPQRARVRPSICRSPTCWNTCLKMAVRRSCAPRHGAENQLYLSVVGKGRRKSVREPPRSAKT